MIRYFVSYTFYDKESGVSNGNAESFLDKVKGIQDVQNWQESIEKTLRAKGVKVKKDTLVINNFFEF